jgi:hypothetical protein
MNIFPFLASNAEAVGAPAISWDAPGIILLKLLAVVFLVLLNGFFVASEFAIVKVRSSQLDALAARGNGQARLARHVTSHLDAYLSATQLGITLASLGLGWLGEPNWDVYCRIGQLPEIDRAILLLRTRNGPRSWESTTDPATGSQ